MAADFRETNAVVTGASSGIGRAVAIALAKSGVKRILIHYCRNESGILETAKIVRESSLSGDSDGGVEVVIESADLGDADQATKLAETAFAKLGKIHTWVNNAGLDVLTGENADLDFDAKLQRLLQVDVMGTIGLSRRVADQMLQQDLQRPASMCFIGWDQAPLGMEGDAGQMFGPVKAAVMAYAASLAQTLAPKVRVNTVAPGWIQTKWGESTSEYWDDRAKQQSLMGRWGSPQDVAQAILFASDPANTFFTGQVIDVNGGWNRTTK